MRQLCSECGKRPALVRQSGKTGVRTFKDHDLCSQCYRAQRNQIRAHDNPVALTSFRKLKKK